MMTDHQLNKVLAKWAGVQIKEHSEDGPGGRRDGLVYLKQRDEKHEIWPWWEPLVDANQMELVKAGLRKHGFSYVIDYWHPQSKFTIYFVDPKGNTLPCIEHKGTEQEAHALAIEQLGEPTP